MKHAVSDVDPTVVGLVEDPEALEQIICPSNTSMCGPAAGPAPTRILPLFAATLTPPLKGWSRTSPHDNVRVSIVVDVATSHGQDRKSTRLNSSHVKISYAVF